MPAFQHRLEGRPRLDQASRPFIEQKQLPVFESEARGIHLVFKGAWRGLCEELPQGFGFLHF
jgi:hypothetical protein